MIKQTREQKRLCDMIKKYCKIKLGEGNDKTMGTIEITRCKISESRIYNETMRTRCEVDIIYKGTLGRFGRKMGPVREICNENNRWLSKWPSKIMRNRVVRSELSNDIISRLKYFGVYVEYKHLITIKKIVWDE